MSRRRRAIKRQTPPDPVYQNVTLAKFINKVMIGGKKATARRIVYDALEIVKTKITDITPLEVFEKALDNVMPQLEVKSRRIGGANYQVPVEIPANRRQSMGMGFLITYSRAKPGIKEMDKSLADELVQAYNNQGASIKKKDDIHRMAEANKAFAQYKF